MKFDISELELSIDLLMSDLETAQVLCAELRRNGPKDTKKRVFLELLDDSIDRAAYQAGEVKNAAGLS